MTVTLSDFAPALVPPADHVPGAIRECDRQGDHRQSLQLLYRLAQQHDMAAVAELGKRLLYGDRAPQAPARGAGLLQTAADAGDGEAMALTALSHALGLLPQSWAKSLTYLTSAAQHGWLPAQGQLLALCNDKREVQNILHGGRDWQALAATIDLDCWASPPPGRHLSESPRIAAIESFLPQAMAQWLIALARPHLQRARVYDAVNKREEVNDYRSNRSVDFSFMMLDVATLLVQKRIGLATGIPVACMEPLSVLHYATGEEIRPHYDFINTKDVATLDQVKAWGQRRMTFITYLNDDYAGGSTTFPKLGLANRGRCGDAIYFVNIREDGEPDLRTQHAGSPPTAGEKWVATQFIRERQVINTDI